MPCKITYSKFKIAYEMLTYFYNRFWNDDVTKKILNLKHQR